MCERLPTTQMLAVSLFLCRFPKPYFPTESPDPLELLSKGIWQNELLKSALPSLFAQKCFGSPKENVLVPPKVICPQDMS